LLVEKPLLTGVFNMSKKAHLVKASVINQHSAENKGALIFVYASADRKINKEEELSAYHCKKCSTEFAALRKLNPICITCGTDDVEEDDTQGLDVESFDSDDELASITCASCGTHNIVTLETASVLGSKIHCSACGEGIEFRAPELSECENEESDEQDDVEFSEANSDLDLSETESDNEDLDEDALEEDADANSDLDLSETESDNEDLDEDDLEDDLEDDADVDSDLDDDEVIGNSDDDEIADEENYSEQELSSMVKGELTLSRINDVIVASVNNLPVATLAKKDSGSNENLFHAASFTTAIQETVKRVGLKNGLSHYGFSLAKVKVPVTKIMKKKVAKKVEKEVAALNTKVDDVIENFDQCFGIALAALNKGFFKGKTNPLKDGFVAQLSTAGIKSAGTVVDKVFKTYGNEMNLAAFELAKDLMGKSQEFRNEIAEAVGESNYQDSADIENDSESDDLDNQPLEARLEGSGLLPRRQTELSKLHSVKNVEVSNIIENVRKLSGGSLFR